MRGSGHMAGACLEPARCHSCGLTVKKFGVDPPLVLGAMHVWAVVVFVMLSEAVRVV